MQREGAAQPRVQQEGWSKTGGWKSPSQWKMADLRYGGIGGLGAPPELGGWEPPQPTPMTSAFEHHLRGAEETVRTQPGLCLWRPLLASGILSY